MLDPQILKLLKLKAVNMSFLYKTKLEPTSKIILMKMLEEIKDILK